MEPWDVTIVGGGVLGTSIAYWLAQRYEGRIAVLEKEVDVAAHTSRRNTGVVHRPFYLDPVGRKVFARCAQVAYGMWKAYAAARGLPWLEISTFEVALREEDQARLEKYRQWGLANGMREVRLAAPEEERVYIDPRRKISVHVGRGREAHRTRFLINCAGGNSIDIAHRLGVGREYTDLHFRGEYWEIDPAHHYLSSRNIYTVPRHPELPFLDPHWIVRADGRREIGPNAVPVSGPYTYRGFFDGPKELSSKLLEVPLRNKLRLLVNPDFVALAAEEGASSVSKRVMAKRAQEFLPSLRVQYLVRPGTAGVRASVVDRSGNFVKEAIELPGPHSYYITNYNSPGATGAPAFAAWTVQRLARAGHLDHLKAKVAKPGGLWDFEHITESIEAPAAS